MSDIFNLLGGMFGGGYSGQSGASGFFGIPSTEEMGAARGAQAGQAGSAMDLFNQMISQGQTYGQQTAPIQQGTMQRYQDILSGNYDPTASPAYGPMRRGVEQAYGGAKENILANLPGGGLQQEALGSLEEQRAGGLSDIMSKILTQELQGAYGVGTGALGQSGQFGAQATQPLSAAGQMWGTILEMLAKQMGAGVQAAGALSPM